MRVVALGVLGFSSDADDAVQDACLIALRRIGDVRDPAAIGPWLRTVTRNASRMRLRQAIGELPLDDPRLNQARTKMAGALRAASELFAHSVQAMSG